MIIAAALVEGVALFAVVVAAFFDNSDLKAVKKHAPERLAPGCFFKELICKEKHTEL